MTRIRTFVGIKLPPDVCRRAEQIIAELSGTSANVKWVSTDNLHISLKFLGDVDETQLAEVCRVVEKSAAGISPFEIQLYGTGAFPRLAKPRVLWIGIVGDLEPLAELQQNLEAGFAKMGYPTESRKYVPHLTLGRVRYGGRGSEDLSSNLKMHAENDFGVCRVEEITTFSSDLTRRGPIYSVIGRAQLRGLARDAASR